MVSILVPLSNFSLAFLLGFLFIFEGIIIIFKKKKHNIEEIINEDVDDKNNFIITNKLSGNTWNFYDEKVNRIIVHNYLGSTRINLKHFDYNMGELEIYVENTLGEVIILTDNNTKINLQIDSTLGECSNTQPILEPKYVCKIIGKNKLGEINIKY